MSYRQFLVTACRIRRQLLGFDGHQAFVRLHKQINRDCPVIGPLRRRIRIFQVYLSDAP